MISRRRLITGAAALASYAALPGRPAKAAANVIAGAVRFDAWYATTANAQQSQNSLGPQQWQFRAPWFSQVLNPYQIVASGNQANMDTEIACAKNAGLKYWAFLKFDPSSTMTVAWNLYQASAHNADVKWCWISANQSDWGSTGNSSTQIAAFVAQFQQSNYQKVLTNRPLIYLLFSSAGSVFGNSNANFAAMITALRAACIGAGLGSPYIVIMAGSVNGSAFATAVGADAISIYVPPLNINAQPVAFSALTSSAEAYWATQTATGLKTIPCCGMGQDPRPRKQNPPSFVLSSYIPAYNGLLNYCTPGTVSERAQQIADCVTYIGAHADCETTAMIIYSWNECDEGGGVLCPTLGDPPTVGNTTNLLTAIGAVLN